MHFPKTLLMVLALAASAHSDVKADPEAAMNKAGCMACHAKDKKVLGPAFKDIAAKRKAEKDAVAMLFDKVRKGGKGVYGPIPMPPTGPDKIGDAELTAALEWVLKQ